MERLCSVTGCQVVLTLPVVWPPFRDFQGILSGVREDGAGAVEKADIDASGPGAVGSWFKPVCGGVQGSSLKTLQKVRCMTVTARASPTATMRRTGP